MLLPKLLAKPLKYEVTLFSKLEAFEIPINKKIPKIEQIKVLRFFINYYYNQNLFNNTDKNYLNIWWPHPDSNRDGNKSQRILSPLRLPIPP